MPHQNKEKVKVQAAELQSDNLEVDLYHNPALRDTCH